MLYSIEILFVRLRIESRHGHVDSSTSLPACMCMVDLGLCSSIVQPMDDHLQIKQNHNLFASLCKKLNLEDIYTNQLCSFGLLKMQNDICVQELCLGVNRLWGYKYRVQWYKMLDNVFSSRCTWLNIMALLIKLNVTPENIIWASQYVSSRTHSQ